MKVISTLPPEIVIKFNSNLLMNTLDRIRHRLENEIKPLAKKKLKGANYGRKEKFIMLLDRFNEVYERKIAEEANYQAEIKEKIKKRSHIPANGGTAVFRRL